MSQARATNAEAFTAEMRDTILWVEWSRSTTVSEDMAMALARRAGQLSPNVCSPMLVQLNGMVSLSWGALHYLATGLDIAAMALVGPSAVDRTLSRFFTQVHRPPYPTHHFDDPGKACTWLTDHPHSPISSTPTPTATTAP